RPLALGELQAQVSSGDPDRRTAGGTSRFPQTPSTGPLRGQAASPPPAARAEGVWKSFGRTQALQDVSLSVHGAECHALVGRNGAGKSTLVGVLTGLLKPDRGAVELHGEPAPGPGDRAAWQQRVACVYQ